MKISNEDLIKGITEAGTITEKEINLLKKRLNTGEQIKFDPESELVLTKEQTNKAFSWLYNQFKTPKGVERKNNPFGYREQKVLEANDIKIFFDGFHNVSRSNQYVFNVPIFTVCGGGGSFQYYVSSGGINIIG